MFHASESIFSAIIAAIAINKVSGINTAINIPYTLINPQLSIDSSTIQ